MYLRTLLACMGLALCCYAPAQQKYDTLRPWTFATAKARELLTTQDTFTYINFTEATFQTITKTMNASSPPVLELPAPDGDILTFVLQPSAVMHPQLAAKYPNIKSWKGTCAEHPALQLRCEFGATGFHALVEGPGRAAFLIEPLAGFKDLYRVAPKAAVSEKSAWDCFTEGKSNSVVLPPVKNNGVFRTYRLALACTGEFSAYYGGTKEGALSAMVTLVNRLNGIFERDLGVHLQLVANNDDIIFLDAANDPFYNSTSHSVLGQNQQACNQYIGVENYDVGHLLTTASGGLAHIKSVCSSNKAKGVSGNNHPAGDAFFVDYVAHELGHQFGASHTQNNNCNRNPATAVEPGSGSTIMGYAGVCTPNVQEHSDAYFHAISIAEIHSYLEQYGNCASLSVLPETLVADAGADLYIPANTPFLLTGKVQYSANPANLTFTWEQMDNELVMMPPLAENHSGPLFRSVFPSENEQRCFPSLDVLIHGADADWEVLPATAREMDFRFCARAGNGVLNCDDKKIHVSNASGPFRLTYPIGGEIWESGEVKTISWTVANTDQAPVNCKKVDILLSVDGGQTFPFKLAENTPNDGACTLVVPPYSSQLAYIMVRASDNVFFDITRQALTLKGPSNYAVAFEVEPPPCHGDATGKLTAYVPGATGEMHFSWSNGAKTQSIENLSAGVYSVTVQVGANTLVGTTEVVAPAPLDVYTVNIPGTGLLAYASGGTEPYEYAWSNGTTDRWLYSLTPGAYRLTVTDARGCSASSTAHVMAQTPAQMEFGVVTANEKWQKIPLGHSYEDMVVIATPIAEGAVTPSVLTRLRNCEGNSFELRLQVAGSANSPTGPVRVSWIAVEAGVYHDAGTGLKFEAGKLVAQATSHAQHWLTDNLSFGQMYARPVVLSQVMSSNDERWSVAWSSAYDDPTSPARGHSFSVGKHIGEDNPYPAREEETIGYVVFETGVHSFGSLRLLAANGPPVVQGLADDDAGFEYPLQGFRNIKAVVLGAAGMAGDEGAWPILNGNFTEGKQVQCWMAEDQVADAERSHLPEAVAILVIGAAEQNIAPEEVDRPKAGQVKLFPNPASASVTLSFEQRELDGPRLEVSDLFGRVLFSQTLLPAEPGIRQVHLPLNSLTEGQYFVYIREAYHFHYGILMVGKL